MPRILIVDDQEINRMAYRNALQYAKIDAAIEIAANEDEANAILSSDATVDVVITDLIMQREDGGEQVLRAAQRKDPLIMVIIITAYEGKLDRYAAFELGAFDCIEKGTPGVKTNQELVAKTKSALKFREIALSQLAKQNEITFLQRYFDPKVFATIRGRRELLEPKNRMVTIVFWDVRGFSLLCEMLKAHTPLLSGFLQEYFHIASEVIFKHSGVLDKFVGDGVMAIFGALNGRESDEDALLAVRAALDMKREFEKVYAKWLAQWKKYTPHAIDIGLGCGIHTGEALVGNLGTEQRDHYTALGTNVNFAARIEGISHKDHKDNLHKRDAIIISSTTKAAVEKEFPNTTYLITLDDIKNIPGSFELFEVS